MDEYTEEINDIIDTANKLGLTEWLKTFNPTPDQGFMFSTDQHVANIMHKCKFSY